MRTVQLIVLVRQTGVEPIRIPRRLAGGGLLSLIESVPFLRPSILSSGSGVS